MALTGEFIRENTVLQKWLKQGLEQGLKQGLRRGEATVLRRLIERRFGPVPRWAGERLEQAKPGQLERWAVQLLDAETIEDVFVIEA